MCIPKSNQIKSNKNLLKVDKPQPISQLQNDNITAEAIASIPTRFLLNDKNKIVIVGCTLGQNHPSTIVLILLKTQAQICQLDEPKRLLLQVQWSYKSTLHNIQ